MYLYIYIERETEREIYTTIYLYNYTCVYLYGYIDTAYIFAYIIILLNIIIFQNFVFVREMSATLVEPADSKRRRHMHTWVGGTPSPEMVVPQLPIGWA